MERLRLFAPTIVCVVLVLSLPPVAHPARIGARHCGAVAPVATPAPAMPLTLDARQAQEVAVLIAFIDAYNGGHVGMAVALFGSPWLWSDCDYRRGAVLTGDGKASLTRWLQGRAADHDQLEIRSITVGTEQETALGVTFKRRTSDALRSLGRPHGIAPTLSAKVIFDDRSSSTGRPSIVRFVNGPFGGSLDFCRLRP